MSKAGTRPSRHVPPLPQANNSSFWGCLRRHAFGRLLLPLLQAIEEPPPPHQSVTTSIAAGYGQVLVAKWRNKGQGRHRWMNREVREHKTGVKAHLRPVEHVGRPNMGGGGVGKGEKDSRCGSVRSVFILTASSNVGCLNYEAPPPADAGKCIWECVTPATKRIQQVSTSSARRAGRLYGAPLVAVACQNRRCWGIWRGRGMEGRCSTPPVDAF